MKFTLLIILFSALFVIDADAQEEELNSLTQDFLRLFLDCQTRCDQTYFRQEMGFVNFMQDRQQADIFLQLSAQRTGTGGREYRLHILGQDKFEGSRDTLIFYTGPDATDNIIRDAILNNIKKSILPFILKTSLKDKIQYSIPNESDEAALNTLVKDPWNYWTFQFRVNSFLNGESQSNFINLNNSLSINRTTEKNKVNMFVRYGYNRSEFDIDDEETVVAINESAFGRILYVFSIDDHWSIGGQAGVTSSSFSNVDFGYGIDPTIEYNVFPYQESSQHQFTFKYNIGPSYRNYTEETVFDVLNEWYWEQQLEINYAQIKDWGTIQIELEYENYLHDFSQLQIGLNPELEWNIAKGLNIDIFTRISYVANLRNIQKGEVDPNDILLQNRQLDTSFQYFGSIGLSYRFGSAYNNIVNTRF